jgi:hypothetical protein
LAYLLASIINREAEYLRRLDGASNSELQLDRPISSAPWKPDQSPSPGGGRHGVRLVLCHFLSYVCIAAIYMYIRFPVSVHSAARNSPSLRSTPSKAANILAMQHLTVLAAIFASSLAQISPDSNRFNPERPVYSCDRLPCKSLATDGVCRFASGVGLVTDAARLPNSNASISLTLVDGLPQGVLQQPPLPFDFSTRTLFVGASSGTDLSSQPPACALLMQYDSATFPYFTNDAPASRNTTTCPGGFLFANDLSGLATSIQNFKYSGNGASTSNSSSASLSRCDALASFVEQKINSNLTFGTYYGALVSVTGGAIAGPEVLINGSQAIYGSQTDPTSCQPSLPQDVRLYNVTSASEILRKYPQSQNSTYGGRTGYSPIVSVVYDSEDDTTPDVSIHCVHLWSINGSSLPYSTLVPEQGVGALTFGRASIGAVTLGLAMGAMMLLS